MEGLWHDDVQVLSQEDIVKLQKYGPWRILAKRSLLYFVYRDYDHRHTVAHLL